MHVITFDLIRGAEGEKRGKPDRSRKLSSTEHRPEEDYLETRVASRTTSMGRGGTTAAAGKKRQATRLCCGPGGRVRMRGGECGGAACRLDLDRFHVMKQKDKTSRGNPGHRLSTSCHCKNQTCENGETSGLDTEALSLAHP